MGWFRNLFSSKDLSPEERALRQDVKDEEKKQKGSSKEIAFNRLKTDLDKEEEKDTKLTEQISQNIDQTQEKTQPQNQAA